MRYKASIVSRATIAALFLPAFFPYVGLLKGIDMQPNGLLAMTLLLALASIYQRLLVSPVLLYLLIATSIIAVARLLSQFLGGNVSPDATASLLAFVQTGFHLLTILVAYLVVCAGVFRPTSRLVGLVVAIYVGVGVLQLAIDEQIGSALVYRGYEGLAETGRGVRSLASEPAVFGNILLVMSGFWILIAARDGWSTRRFLMLQAAILASTALLAQSTYAILLQLIIFFACTVVVSKRLFLALCLVLVWLLATFLIGAETQGIRAFFILQTLIENPALLYEQGAMLRVMNVPISLYGGALHGMFGSGFGGETLVSGLIPALPGNPYSFEVADRNLGGLVELYLRLGVGALPLMFFVLQRILRIARLSAILGSEKIRIGIPLAIVIFLTCFTYSSIGNPMIWLLFFSVLAWNQEPRTIAYSRSSNANVSCQSSG